VATENVLFVAPFVAALQADGLEFRDGKLVPTTPGPASLGPERSILEQELVRLGAEVAATHYRQAAENFADGNWEACNGQIRRSWKTCLLLAASVRAGGGSEIQVRLFSTCDKSVVSANTHGRRCEVSGRTFKTTARTMALAMSKKRFIVFTWQPLLLDSLFMPLVSYPRREEDSS
jgi:hypothetical protein